MFSIVFYAWVVAQRVVAQDFEQYSLYEVLSAQPQLTNFTTLLSLSPVLFSQVSAGNYTILAPSDEAFADYLASNSDFVNDTALDATLSYHLVHGVYPLVDFETGVQFLPTLLTDANFSNVTGGQRVGVYPTNQGIVFESGIKSRSKLNMSDILYTSGVDRGIIHIIDKVLEIPAGETTAVTKAGLNGVIAISFSFPLSPKVVGALGAAPDWTLFLPNSTLSDITEMPTDVMLEIEEYHFVFGHIFYSPDLKDNLQIQSLLGPNLTITVAPNGTRYVNDAEIIYSDYLLNTGVMHVLEHNLSPNETTARPNLSTHTNSTIPTDTPTITRTPAASASLVSSPLLITGTKAAIGVGAGVGVLLLTGALYFCFSRNKSKNGTAYVQGKNQYASEMPHHYRLYLREMEAPGAGRKWELDGYESRRARIVSIHEMQ